MKIVNEDQNLMILKDRGVVAFIVGAIFLFAGLIVIVKPDFFTNQPPLWPGFIGILLGGFVIVMTKVTTIKIDKSINKLSFLRKGLSGESSREYDLNQVKEVELSVGYHTSKNSGGYSYHITFVLNNGEVIPLNPGSSTIRGGIMGARIIPEKTMGARISAFMGVPFQERRPPTVTETLLAVSSAIQKAKDEEKKTE